MQKNLKSNLKNNCMTTNFMINLNILLKKILMLRINKIQYQAKTKTHLLFILEIKLNNNGTIIIIKRYSMLPKNQI